MSQADQTMNQALDQVKSLREAWAACNGALYKNIAVDQMQTFLEKCIARWGPQFMECVKRERSEEVHGKEATARFYGEKGKRIS